MTIICNFDEYLGPEQFRRKVGTGKPRGRLRMGNTADNLKSKAVDQKIVAELRKQHGHVPKIGTLTDVELYAAYQDWLLAQGEGAASETFPEWIE